PLPSPPTLSSDSTPSPAPAAPLERWKQAPISRLMPMAVPAPSSEGWAAPLLLPSLQPQGVEEPLPSPSPSHGSPKPRSYPDPAATALPSDGPGHNDLFPSA
ncbi:unnamed protein product, partial [Phaeothamnion confervicola]